MAEAMSTLIVPKTDHGEPGCCIEITGTVPEFESRDERVRYFNNQATLIALKLIGWLPAILFDLLLVKMLEYAAEVTWVHSNAAHSPLPRMSAMRELLVTAKKAEVALRVEGLWGETKSKQLARELEQAIAKCEGLDMEANSG